jgi:hypothetical protein
MKKKTFRVLVAAGIPLALIAYAVLLRVLTHLLDQTVAGKVLMVIFILVILAKAAHMAWTWPGWSAD